MGRLAWQSIVPVVSAAFGLGFLFSAQGQELLRGFAEDALRAGTFTFYRPAHLIEFVAAWWLWCCSTWYWARHAADERLAHRLGSVCALPLPWAYQLANHIEFRQPQSHSVVVALLQVLALQLVAYVTLESFFRRRPLAALRRLVGFGLLGIGLVLASIVPAVHSWLGPSGPGAVAALAYSTVGAAFILDRWRGARTARFVLAVTTTVVWASIEVYGAQEYVPQLLAICSIVPPWFFTHQSQGPAGEPGRGSVGVVSLAVFSIAILTAAFQLSPAPTGSLLGAATVLLIALAAWSTVLAFAMTRIPRRRQGGLLFAILLVLAVASAFNDNHSLQGVSARQADYRDTIAGYFEKWRRANRHVPHDPVLVIAASGGGLRAAFWTAQVWSHVDDETCGAFSRHVFAISGVSGGSLGAAAQVALLADVRDGGANRDECWPDQVSTRDGSTSAMDATREFLTWDFLSPALGNMLFPDLIQRFVPYPLFRDRAFALETGFEHRWRETFHTDRFAQPFLSLYAGGPAIPALFLNTTTVEEGARAVIANVKFAPGDGFDLLAPGRDVENLRLSTAVHNSARFSYMSPAGTVKATANGQDGVWGRLVDGGYFENSGAATLKEVVNEIAAAQGGKRDNIFAIIISNDPMHASVCGGQPAPAAAAKRAVTPRSYLSETLSPIKTLLATREARGRLAERELVESVGGCGKVLDWSYGDRFSYSEDDRYYQTIAVNPGEPPLAWYLSLSSQRKLMLDPWLLYSRMPFCVMEVDETGAAAAPIDDPFDVLEQGCRIMLKRPYVPPRRPQFNKH